MRDMWRFYWPVCRNIPGCLMKAGHGAHTIVFLVSLTTLVTAGFYESKAIMVISFAILILLMGWNFLVSIYERHCSLLEDQAKTIHAPAIAKNELILKKLQSLYDARNHPPSSSIVLPAEQGWRESVDRQIADLEKQL